MVSRDDAGLKKLLDEFVCVRRVQMGGVDLNIFQFDPYVSWSIFFMRADKTIYGRFGTAHPDSKRSKADSNPNHTLPGLKAAMRGALDLHKRYAEDPAGWAKALAAKTGPAAPWRYPETTPVSRKYKRHKHIKGGDTKGCVHCHELPGLAIDSFFMKKRPVTDRMLWAYPLPDTMGLTFSTDHMARVTAIAAGSLADNAGIKRGDDLTTLAGQPLLSPADFQWVLENAPDEGGTLPVELKRAGKTVTTKLELGKLWRRKTDFAWRYRMAGYAMWLWGGVTLADSPRGVTVAAPSPGWFKRQNKDARKELKKGDLILEVDGKTGWTRSTYLAYLMREKKPGSTVKLKLERGGKKIKASFRVPKPRPEVLGH